MVAASSVFLVAALAWLLWPRPAPYEAQVFGFANDAPVQQILAELEQAGGNARIVFNDLAQHENGERFTRLLTIINIEANIPFLPNSVERRDVPPYTHFHNQNRYYGDYLSSLVGVFHGARLVAVVMGGQWYGPEFWGKLFAAGDPPDGARIFVPSGTYELTDENIITELSLLFRRSAAAGAS